MMHAWRTLLPSKSPASSCLLSWELLGWSRDVGEGPRPGDVSHIHMTRKAGRERSILGTEVEKPK